MMVGLQFLIGGLLFVAGLALTGIAIKVGDKGHPDAGLPGFLIGLLVAIFGGLLMLGVGLVEVGIAPAVG